MPGNQFDAKNRIFTESMFKVLKMNGIHKIKSYTTQFPGIYRELHYPFFNITGIKNGQSPHVFKVKFDQVTHFVIFRILPQIDDQHI